jgi:RNA polymerase sigma-B factor
MAATAQREFPAGDDRQLIRRHRAGDPRARALLIERYLPLARRLALRYRHSNEPVDDLVQVASLGLIKATDRWEPERGLAFSSYAVPTILGELRRHFRDATWAVRPSRSLLELALSVEKAHARLHATTGREPTLGDLAVHVGRSEPAVLEALRAAAGRSACALEGPALQLGEDDAGYARAEDRATLEQLMTALDRRARDVLHLRFCHEMLQSQIAAHTGCSQGHVSRTLRTSLEQLHRVAFEPRTPSEEARWPIRSNAGCPRCSS